MFVTSFYIIKDAVLNQIMYIPDSFITMRALNFFLVFFFKPYTIVFFFFTCLFSLFFPDFMFVTQWIYVPSEYSQSHTSVFFFFWRYYVETLASSFDFADHQEPCVTPRRKVWTTTNHASAQKRDLEKHFFVCRVLGANMKHAFLVTADFLTHVFLLFSFLTHLIDRRCLLLVFSFPPMKHQQLFVLFLYSFSDIYIYMCSFIFSYLPFFFYVVELP